MRSLSKDKFLSPTELLELTTRFHSDPSRDALIIETSLYTGARPQEVLNLELRDIDLLAGMIMIRGLKGSLDREIPLPTHLRNKYKSYLGNGNFENQEKLFPISTRRYRQIWERYSPNGKSLKSCRHAFAIELFKRHKDIRLVQFALGHCNIQNTLVYSSYIYKTEELKKLFNFNLVSND